MFTTKYMNFSGCYRQAFDPNIIQFAIFRNHIGLYPGPEAVEAFAGRLCGYRTSKGTIQLPYEKPLPLDLIREIAKWCRQEYGR